jgi:hypothetical protein
MVHYHGWIRLEDARDVLVFVPHWLEQQFRWYRFLGEVMPPAVERHGSSCLSIDLSNPGKLLLV